MPRSRIIIAMTALLLFATVAVAHASDTGNAACLECHSTDYAGTQVDFAVAAVDYDSCSACHWIGMNDLIWDRWGHKHITADPGASCTDCHYPLQDYPNLPYFYTPTYPTPFGIFDTADSLSTSAEEIHAIHVNGSWPQDQDRRTNYCGSCHAPAGCTTCHPDSFAHDAHSPQTVVYEQALGTPQGNPDVLNFPAIGATCVSASCHALATPARVAVAPECGVCHEEAVGGHDADHDATGAVNRGCSTCHSMSVDETHELAGYGCQACHASEDAAVIEAVESGNAACSACHASPVHRGRSR